MSTEEKKKHLLLQQLGTLGHEKEATRKQSNLKRRAEHLRKQALEDARKAPRRKDELKALYRRLGKEESKRLASEQGFGASKHKKRKVNKDKE
jgi:hypothetical protein